TKNQAAPPLIRLPRSSFRRCWSVGSAVSRQSAESTNTSQRFTFPVKQGLYPINDRPDAGCPAQIAMNDEPIIGRDLWRRRHNTFKQRVGIADKAGQNPLPGTGADRR